MSEGAGFAWIATSPPASLVLSFPCGCTASRVGCVLIVSFCVLLAPRPSRCGGKTRFCFCPAAARRITRLLSFVPRLEFPSLVRRSQPLARPRASISCLPRTGAPAMFSCSTGLHTFGFLFQYLYQASVAFALFCFPDDARAPCGRSCRISAQFEAYAHEICGPPHGRLES